MLKAANSALLFDATKMNNCPRVSPQLCGTRLCQSAVVVADYLSLSLDGAPGEPAVSCCTTRG